MTAVKGKKGDDARVDALWRFCLELYPRPGVTDACLSLQDNHGADVNILLLLAWLDEQGWPPLMYPDLATLVGVSETWQKEIISPLRQLRRQIKGACTGGAEPVYESIKHSELMAERAEQRALIGRLDNLSVQREQRRAGASRLRDNLLTYGDVIGVDDAGQQALSAFARLVAQ